MLSLTSPWPWTPLPNRCQRLPKVGYLGGVMNHKVLVVCAVAASMSAALLADAHPATAAGRVVASARALKAQGVALPDPESQAQVSMALNKLQEQYPNDFAYARGGEQPTVAFRGSVPAGVSSVLTGLPRSVSFVEGAGFTHDQVVAKQQVLNKILVSSLGPEGIGLSIDETGSVNVTMRLRAPAPSDGPNARTAANVNAILASASSNIGGAAVRLIDGQSSSGEASRWAPTGGTGVATSLGGSANYCTEGFVAKRSSSSDLGPLIAGHCATQTTLWHNGGLPDLTLRVAVNDSRGDAAFYRSSQMMAGIIRTNWGVFAGIHGHYNPSIGDTVCRFGVASGATCQVVMT